ARRWLAGGGAALAGLALGAASAWGAVVLGGALVSERHGEWEHSGAAGASSAGPYTRAIVAREGLLALSPREALYFTLDRDERSRLLDEKCAYALGGGDFNARWWSVTLYASDDYLAQNNDNAHSIDATGIAAGAWNAKISSLRAEAPHWISSRGAGPGFSLTLRVYQPDPEFQPSVANLPTLTTLSCGAS
ncbi:MAG: DUF1214 domain-containing protein, partial [Terricaulis sp.]